MWRGRRCCPATRSGCGWATAAATSTGGAPSRAPALGRWKTPSSRSESIRKGRRATPTGGTPGWAAAPGCRCPTRRGWRSAPDRRCACTSWAPRRPSPATTCAWPSTPRTATGTWPTRTPARSAWRRSASISRWPGSKPHPLPPLHQVERGNTGKATRVRISPLHPSCRPVSGGNPGVASASEAGVRARCSRPTAALRGSQAFVSPHHSLPIVATGARTKRRASGPSPRAIRTRGQMGSSGAATRSRPASAWPTSATRSTLASCTATAASPGTATGRSTLRIATRATPPGSTSAR